MTKFKMISRKLSVLLFLMSGLFWWQQEAVAATSTPLEEPAEPYLPGPTHPLGNTQEIPGREEERSREALEVLDRLVREALDSNPSIQAARSRWMAGSKRPSQVATLPNPELGFSSMTSGNPLPYSTLGMGPVDWASFMFRQRIPWPGKLALDGEVAETEATIEARRYQAVTLEIVREVKEVFFQLHYLHQTERILDNYRDLTERFARIAEVRYGVGEGLLQDVLRAQVEVSMIVERLEILQGKREGAEARLNTLLNRPPEEPLPQIPIFSHVIAELPFSLEGLYLMARERNPEIDAERLQIQKATVRRERARREFRPDFTVSAGYLMRGGEFSNMYQYSVGVEIPLYWRRKERFGVEETVEVLEGSRHEYHRRLQEVTYRIRESYINARTARRLMELYRTGIIPQATAALDSALSAYQVGTVDFLTLTNNALTILDYELQYAEELREYHRNLVRLEEQLGVAIVGGVHFANEPAAIERMR